MKTTMNIPWLLVSLVLLVVCTLNEVRGELFTSQAALEHLIRWEREMLRRVVNYVQAEEEKLQGMKNIISKVEGTLKKVNVFSSVINFWNTQRR